MDTIKKTPVFATASGVISALGELNRPGFIGMIAVNMATLARSITGLHAQSVYLIMTEDCDLGLKKADELEVGWLLLAEAPFKSNELKVSATLKQFQNGAQAEELASEFKAWVS